MSSFPRCALVLSVLVLFFRGAGAIAATACVSNTAQLALVLNAAQGNGEDDLIRLETGTYSLNGELEYFAAAAETKNLAIYGGYGPGCLADAASGSTVIDGQHAHRLLYVIAKGRVDIGRITFQNGNPGSASGGGVIVSGAANTVLTVTGNAFVTNDCPGADSGAALEIGATGTILVADNLFLANSGGSTLYVANGGYADVNNNTIVANQLGNHVGLGAFEPTGSGQYYVDNNIFWNNEGADVYDQSGLASYFNNDIGVFAGMAAYAETANLSVDPAFDGILSVRPSPGSPLVNAGLDNPYGGIGSVDLSGATRLVGRHVDIGAYETDVLFRAMFD